jgi:hypothetical protein
MVTGSASHATTAGSMACWMLSLMLISYIKCSNIKHCHAILKALEPLEADVLSPITRSITERLGSGGNRSVYIP